MSLHAEANSSSSEDLKIEAERLLELAKELRSDIASSPAPVMADKTETVKQTSPWSVLETDNVGVGYRLYIDIGREEGTWMDPRWGASGRRIQFTLDLTFLVDLPANETVKEKMVKDNFGGRSSDVKMLTCAPFARLRNGFDRMKCRDGGYRIDVGGNGASTVRFYVLVDGTETVGSSYGDVFVPEGPLYFSLPCFEKGVTQLSAREGPVTVCQIGWHTGWRRDESRIVGTFRAVPIKVAQERDGF